MEQKILTGERFEEALRDIWKERGTRAALLVCGDSFRAQRCYKTICSLAGEMQVELVEFSDFYSNPDYASTVAGTRIFKEHRCDFLIAAGGGSAMDVAKCVKLFSSMGDIPAGKTYLEQEITGNDTPFLAIPTTAGTGSEATHFAVIYYEGNKQSVNHGSSIPDYVLFDASFLDTLPLYQKKVTMLDVFCHAAEAFWSVNSTQESRGYSTEAIKLLLQYKDAYLANDREGGEKLLRAANLAGKAINITQTTAGHAMAYKLTSLYGLPHGHAAALCVAVVWPYMAGHMEACIDPRGKVHLQGIFREIAEAMGCASVEESVQKYRSLLKELSIKAPVLKEEYGLDVLRSSVDPGRLKNNPVSLDEGTLTELYRRIFEEM